MTDVIFKQYDEVNVRLVAEDSILMELSEEYTFEVEGAKYHPKVRRGFWDGKIRMLDKKTHLIYKGLIPVIIEYLESQEYTYEFEDNVFDNKKSVTDQNVIDFYKYLDAPYIPKDYQIEAVKTSINNQRAVILSPTASGKSYFLYGLSRYYQKMGLKVLVVVHRVGLVKQLIQDNFCEEYDKNNNSFSTHMIYAGEDKYVKADITATTWQSIVKMPEAWFTGINPKTGNKVKTPDGSIWEGYDVIIADEVHAWKATSTISIMSKCTTQKVKIGTTGTLDDISANKLTIQGLFGPAIKVASTKELMDRGDIAKLKINAFLLNYPQEDCKAITEKGITYDTELKFIYNDTRRDKFLRRLISNLEGNILIAFRHREHGLKIMSLVKNENKFYADGTVHVDKRSEFAKEMDKSTNMVGVVSLGVFAEGINIKNVNHVIIACPIKTKIKLLQMIGRGLRLSEIKDSVTIWDMADNLKYKKKNNFTLNHFIERMKRYKEEGFKIEIHEYNL